VISVVQALDRLFALVTPLETEIVELRKAGGRVLREPAAANRNQPPFDASAMDGYAVRADEASVGAVFRVIGESAAGQGFEGTVRPGEAVRIFTGAPLPDGSDRIIIQEDVIRDGQQIIVGDGLGTAPHVRAAGSDFAAGDQVSAPRRLRPSDLALLAAMNVAEVTVSRRPQVALMCTGDELVMPGERPGPDQIIASNVFGLAETLRLAGAEARVLPIARDRMSSIGAALDLARGADLLVTIGGASVGDHDLVGRAMADAGMQQSFYKVAMRPGKPLMAGQLGSMAMIGLPGNPVSAMVCGEVFLRPMVDAMLGLGARPRRRETAPLMQPMHANGGREHYMRGTFRDTGVAPLDRQDSSLLSVLAAADALIIRPPNDPERVVGDKVEFIRL
jgi:molybdopterin molybdotransferase